MIVDGGTNIGAVRDSNQDACECGFFSDDMVWAIVCDGMGGANGGNVASRIAVDEIQSHLLKTYKEGISDGDIKSMLINAITKANAAVYERACDDVGLQGMGTTAVVMVAGKDKLHVAHVGDSRAYLKQDNEIMQLTIDHSFVQNLIDFGQITESEARKHPKRNIITRAIGVHEQVKSDYTSVPFPTGSLAMACSDGLTTYVNEATFLKYAEKYSGKELVGKLIEYAVKAGGVDNITVVLIHNA